MPQDETGEWGESFDEAEMPRRDRVPPTGFSLPADFNSNPELTSFIPAFRARRRKIAARVSLAVLAALVFMGTRLAMWASAAGTGDARPYGIFSYFFLIGCVVAGFFGVRQTWRWANAPDPADVRNPIMRGLPPPV